MIALHPSKALGPRLSQYLFAIFTLLIADMALSGQSKLAMIEPKQAVMLAADAYPSSVPGIFSLRVKATGSENLTYFLNSEIDYRDQRNLTIALSPAVASQIQEQFGKSIKAIFISKQIYVTGSAKRVRINFFDSNGKATGAYYFQTHVIVKNLDQLRIGSQQLISLSNSKITQKPSLPPRPLPPPPMPNHDYRYWFQQDVQPKQCDYCQTWNAPRAPFKIHGNTYYVGVDGLSSVLITSPQGHVLIDGGLPQSAPRIIANIEQLGFNIRDVKWLLTSHPHFDHVGGLAALQRLSGARVAASPESRQALLLGRALASDPQAGYGDFTAFPALKHVKRIHDGDSLVAGSTVVTAVFTPGHSPGGTSWVWPSCEATQCVNIVFGDSLNPVSHDDYRFSAHPEYLAAFKRSISVMRGLKCDILISAHPGFSNIFERAATGNFINSKACQEYADDAAARLNKRQAEEAANQKTK
jgi:metallo-beta-lactamase class B